ncbi:MAG TPA: hypothetical protein VGJ95_09270 [Pseudonocardiaceae bacterium]
MPGRVVSSPPVDGATGIPVGALAAVAVTIGAVATGGTGHPARSLFALCVVVATLAGLTTVPATLGTAAVAWGLHAGFVLGRSGDLALTLQAADAAAVLLGTALAGCALAAAVRLVAGMAARLTRTAVLAPPPAAARTGPAPPPSP